jgi:hypothetical protein
MSLYQMHCQYCYRRFEGETIEEALKKVEEHEETCFKKKDYPAKMQSV